MWSLQRVYQTYLNKLQASQVALVVKKKKPTCQSRRCERRDSDLWVGKIPLEESIATHSSILGWRIPWTEEVWWVTVHRVERVKHDKQHTRNTHTHVFSKHFAVFERNHIAVVLQSVSFQLALVSLANHEWNLLSLTSLLASPLQTHSFFSLKTISGLRSWLLRMEQFYQWMGVYKLLV